MIDIGSVVNGKYRLVRLVGDGGMGSVYEGQHAVLGTRVAIKVLHPELARRTGLVERFLQEARVAAQIRSPYVVQVTDVDRTADGHAYIVMELLEGESLAAVLDRQRRLPVAQACEYTGQILTALESAHALGVIHRDLKPENVFVTFLAGRPVLKLIDFGIAKAKPQDQQRKLTVAGVVMGTAEYMAPEQARSADKVDARADLYAVGVMLYEMLAGSRPVSGDDARVIALKVERGEVVPLVQAAPDVPRELAGLVHRAMAPVPELRFASATEMRLALERVAARRSTGVQPSSPSLVATPAPPPPERGAGGTLRNIPAQPALAPPPGPTPPPPSVPPMSVGRTPVGTDGADAAPHTQRVPVAAPVTGAPPPHTYPGASPPGAMPGLPGFLGGGSGTSIGGSPAGALPSHLGQGPVVPRGRGAGEGSGRRRQGRGVVLALVGLSLLLGAGVVGILVASGNWPTSGPDPAPRAPLDLGPAVSPVETSPTAAPSAAPPGVVPPLSPTHPSPPPPGPGPAPRPTPSGHPAPSAPDAGAPPSPYLNPSTLPIPGVVPLPPGFPTTLPGFPPWPGQPQPAPTSSHTNI